MSLFRKRKLKSAASTGAKTVAVVFGVVAAIGGLAGIVYMVLFSNAKIVLGRAFLNTFVTETMACADTFGDGVLLQNIRERGMELESDIWLENIPLDIGLGEISLPKIGMEVDVCTNSKRESAVGLEIKVAGASLLESNAYVDSEQIQLNVPKLSDTTLALEYGSDSFREDLKQSYLVEYMGISETVLDEWFEYGQEPAEPPDTEQMNQELLEMLLAALQENFTGLKPKKAGKAEISIGKDTRKCKVYTLVLEKGRISGFLYDCTDGLKDYIKEFAKQFQLDETEVEFLLSRADGVIRDIRASVSDVTITFYVSKSRLVKMTTEWNMSRVLGDSEEGSVELEFAVTEHPLENMKMKLSVPIPQDPGEPFHRVNLEYAIETEHTKDTYEVKCKAKCNEKQLSLSFDYDKTKSDFKFQVQSKHWELKLNGSIPESETEIRQLDNAPSDVLAMNRGDFEALLEEIKQNLSKSAFGMFGFFS
ncbi:MAG: hypothetical protein IKL28_07070 [Lachnospiraceae bacterium]|nr:hypothetical protein [Lachnospiraceae bacterium]